MEDVSEPEDHRAGTAAKAFEAVRSTCMAIPETLVFKNLGIDAPLSAPQALVLCLAIAWFWSRGGLRRPNRLEAAGAVMVVGSYLMVFYFRGYMAYEHMRVVGWYNAIPELGAILFVAGWWARSRGLDPAGPVGQASRLDDPEPASSWSRSPAACWCSTCPGPRGSFLEDAPRMTDEEAARFPTPELQRLGPSPTPTSIRLRQRRALSRLEGAERTADAWASAATRSAGLSAGCSFPASPSFNDNPTRRRCWPCPTATGARSTRHRTRKPAALHGQ